MKPTPGKTYETQRGDTLESVATQAYGDPNQYSRIISVNQSQIKYDFDEDIPVGTSLIIPVDSELDLIRSQQLENGLSGVR
jgi:nucleoid-associated protein YgaU